MGVYDKESQLWEEICENCPSDEEYFYGIFCGVWSDTYMYVSQADTVVGKFALALCTKDMEAIERLYHEIELTDSQKIRLERIKKNNKDYKQTLNLGLLDDKYDFLDKYIDLIASDKVVQERLLSLNDKDLSLFKRIYERLLEYNINISNIIYNVLETIGKRIIPAWNQDDKYTYREFRDNVNVDKLTPQNIDDLIYVFSLRSYMKFTNLNTLMEDLKNELINNIASYNQIEDIKNYFLYAVYGFDLEDCNSLIKMFSMEEIPEEYQNEEVIYIYDAIKSIVLEDDIEVLRNVCLEFLKMFGLNNSICKAQILIEKLKQLYAKILNDQCNIEFSKDKLLKVDGNVKFYNAGTEFFLKAKVLGAFSDEGKNNTNYSKEWNAARYSTHLNATSLISSDNLSFAKGAEESVVVGFNDMNINMLAAMNNYDSNSVVDSRGLAYNILHNNSYYAVPRVFINNTRKSHNEIDYERQDFSEDATYFKKNPDYLIYVQEANDLNNLSEEVRNKQQATLEMTIKAAKDFGNLPILVINREDCAITERNKIEYLLRTFTETLDFNYARQLIIKYGNNRNGCREGHEYIRETYFSNDYFKYLMKTIVNYLRPEDKDLLCELLDSEGNAIDSNFYDETFDVPYFDYTEEIREMDIGMGL